MTTTDIPRMKCNRIPYVPSLLDEILREYRDNWLHGFLFTRDPIHVQHLLSDVCMTNAVLGEVEATTSNTGTTTMMSNEGSETSKTNGIQFFVPVMTVFPVTAGFGSARLRIRLRAESLPQARDMNTDLRFAINAESGTMLTLHNHVNENSVTLVYTRRDRDATYITKAIFCRDGFAMAAEKDAGLDTKNLLKYLKYFTNSRTIRFCVTCAPAGCVCALQNSVARRFRPTHPFDSTLFRNAALSFLGYFHGTSENVVFEKGFPVFSYADSSCYGIKSLANRSMIKDLRTDALTRHAYTVTYSPRVDTHLLEANATSQLKQYEKSTHCVEEQNITSQDTNMLSSHLQSDSGLRTERGVFGKELHLLSLGSAPTSDMSAAVCHPYQEPQLDESALPNRKSLTIPNTDPCAVLSGTNLSSNNGSPTREAYQAEIAPTFTSDLNLNLSLLTGQAAFTSCANEQQFKSASRNAQAEVNVLYDLLVDPLLHDDSFVEGDKEKTIGGTDQNNNHTILDVLEASGAIENNMRVEPTELCTFPPISEDTITLREATTEFVSASMSTPYKQPLAAPSLSKKDDEDEITAEVGKREDDEKKRMRQKILDARRERNRASARRSNARVKKARETLLYEIDKTKLRVDMLREREKKLRLENLNLRKRTQITK